MKVDLTGLRVALEKFEENGEDARCGSWRITKGGYDRWWELYYDGTPIFQCVAGELKSVDNFLKETERKVERIIRSVYTDMLRDGEKAMKFNLRDYKCTISVTDGEQVSSQDFYVEAESFEEAVAKVQSDLDICF